MQTSTTFEVPGFRTLKSLGIVRGITVRSRSLPMLIVAGYRLAFGGRIGILVDLCAATRDECHQLMLDNAEKLGANAVVGVRYETGQMAGAAEVMCYGTAVIVGPL
jgi:uncharacterized protein YbjQ (UPF0145 family)